MIKLYPICSVEYHALDAYIAVEIRLSFSNFDPTIWEYLTKGNIFAEQQM